MTTEEKINQLQAHLFELRKELKPKFEVGKWYKVDGTPFMKYLNKYHTVDSNFGYGINLHGEWTNSEFGLDSATPATDKEVEEALIKEAERRGFKEGVKYTALGVDGSTLSSKGLFNQSFVYKDNHLWCGYGFIFVNGKWAEITKDEPIKVGVIR